MAQAMLSTGNWISPPAYDGAVPSKPPFSHWLMAVASLPKGEVTEATARLPTALAVILFAAGFFSFLASRIQLSAATGVSLVLLSSSEWFRSASTCRVDMLLATSMAGALLGLFSWWERDFRGIPWLVIALISCAALTKGPVGIVLPLGLFSFFCWARTGFRLAALFSLSARAAALAVPVLGVVSVWYLLGYAERGELFLQKVWYENVERFTSSMADEPHKHSVMYLFGMLVIGLLPWTVCLLPLCTLKRFQAWRLNRSLLHRATTWWLGLPPLYQFSCVVAFGVISFFCIPASKRSVYLLPAYPFLAIVLEPVLRYCGEHFESVFGRSTHCIRWFLYVTAVVAGVLICSPIAGVSLDVGAFTASLTVSKVMSTFVALAILYGIWRSTAKRLVQEPVEQLAIVMIGSVTIVSFFIYDTVSWQLSPKRWVFKSEIEDELVKVPSPKIFSYGSEAYGASFYLAKPFSRVSNAGVASGDLVFLEQRRVEEFESKIGRKTTEVLRYSSRLASPRRDIIVLKVEAKSER